MRGPLALLPLLLLQGCLHVTRGQTLQMGKCSDPPAQEEFDVSKYLGKWFVIEKLMSNFEQNDCLQTNYSWKENGRFKVVNKELLSDGSVREVEGEPWQGDPQRPAHLQSKFNWFLPAAPSQVVSTDYAHYSLVYSCTGVLWAFHVEDTWILARSPQLQPDTVELLKGALRSHGISTARMRPADQRDCPADM